MIIAIFSSGMDSIVYIQQSSGPGASTTMPMTLRLLMRDAGRDDGVLHLQGALARG
jgi:hypothetical protein